VCCGLCGRWFRALGGHLGPAHDWTADDYRAAFGLNAQRPLQAPAVSATQAKTLKHRQKTDPRLQAGMRYGLALARSGSSTNSAARQTFGEAVPTNGNAEPRSKAPTWASAAQPASARSAIAAHKPSATPTRSS
jgi:hypothetical protein